MVVSRVDPTSAPGSTKALQKVSGLSYRIAAVSWDFLYNCQTLDNLFVRPRQTNSLPLSDLEIMLTGTR